MNRILNNIPPMFHVSVMYFLTYLSISEILAPISVGIIQFRLAVLLRAAILIHPYFLYAYALAGLVDIIAHDVFSIWRYCMIPVILISGFISYKVRHKPSLALHINTILIALGAAVFVYGFGNNFFIDSPNAELNLNLDFGSYGSVNWHSEPGFSYWKLWVVLYNFVPIYISHSFLVSTGQKLIWSRVKKYLENRGIIQYEK